MSDQIDDFDDDDYDDGENEPLEDCPHCGRSYDEIDFDYQICSKCGWNADKNEPTGNARRPSSIDYLNGDADIITGTWY